MEHDIAQKAVQEGERLQQARRDFAALQREEAAYLADREAKAQALLESVTAEIETAEKLLAATVDKAAKRSKELASLVARLSKGLFSTLDRARLIIARADTLQERAQDTLETYEDLIESVKEAIAHNSALERDLKSKEKALERREEKAEQKLKEAEDLAYWHKSGKRYHQPITR